MDNANLKLLERLNIKGRRRIVRQAKIDKIKQRYNQRREALKASHDLRVGHLEAANLRDDAKLWQAIDKHRDQLTPGGERSFTTRWVRFQFKKVPASLKVKDADAILKVARRRRALRQVGRRVWVLDSKMLFDYLKDNPEQYKYYQEFIEDAPEHETLSIKLNEGHDEIFDNVRLTAKAVPVKKSPPR